MKKIFSIIALLSAISLNADCGCDGKAPITRPACACDRPQSCTMPDPACQACALMCGTDVSKSRALRTHIERLIAAQHQYMGRLPSEDIQEACPPYTQDSIQDDRCAGIIGTIRHEVDWIGNNHPAWWQQQAHKLDDYENFNMLY